MRDRLVSLVRLGAAAVLAVMAPTTASAQMLGTFSWQLQPYCNVITVTVVQIGSTYTLDGFDDQCGAPQRAPLAGVATLNPDGSIGFGLHLTTSPAALLGIEARISMSTLSGTWQDTANNVGTLAYAVSTGGSPRPPAPRTFIYNSPPIDFAVTGSTTLTVPLPPAQFFAGAWQVYLVRASGNVYPIPGPGLNGTSTYRVFAFNSGSQTSITVSRASGSGEEYQSIRVVRVP
jgi:hypothetical protein